MLTRLWLAVLLAALILTAHPNISAQAVAAEPDIRGTWILTIDGEPETRTLIVSEAAVTSNGALLSAKYGITNKGQSVIEAKISRTGGLRELNLVTQAAAVIAASEQPDGTFSGTFTRRNGVASNVTIARATASLAVPPLLPQKDLAILMPRSPDIPAECTAFHGVWSARWSQGGFAEQYLRVLEVTKKEDRCVLRISYSSSKEPVAARTLVNLQVGDNLSFVCNRSTGGICTFKRVGSDLWASYSNTSGGNNSAVFRPVPQ